MKKTAFFAAPFLIIASCSSPSGGSDEYTTSDVTLGQVDFNHHKLTIAAGTTVKFMTEHSGATHILCIGENGSCQSSALGPSDTALHHPL
jgi:plastocyanin